MSFPTGSYPMRDQTYPSHQANFGPAPGNPGDYAWGHASYPPYPYPQGTQKTPWYGPPQAPNHPFPSGTAHYPTEPQMPYPSYGSGHYSASQWRPNPEPHNRGHSRSSHSHPSYDDGAHTSHPRRGPAELPQQQFYLQTAPSSTSEPIRRRPSEPPEDPQTLPNFSVDPTPHANGHGAYTPHPGRDLPHFPPFPPPEAFLWNPAPQFHPNPEPQNHHSRPSHSHTYDHGAHTPYLRRGPAELPQQHFYQTAPSSTSGPVRRRPSEPPEDTHTLPNTPYRGHATALPQQPFPPQEASSWMPQTPGPVRRYPSEPAEGTQSFPNPTLGPTTPFQLAPTPTASYHLATLLVPNVSRYPSIDWNITLPIGSARLWTSPKDKTMIDFEPFAIYPPVRTVTIVARKDLSPLGLALKLWGPIKIRAEERLTIGNILNEIKKYFDTPILDSDKKRMDRYMRQSIPASNSTRWKTQEDDRAVWGKSVQIEVCRADTLFENFQYAGLVLHKDFPVNRKIELTLENARVRYLN